MTRRKVWRWFVAGAVGLLLAFCAGIWFLPGTGPSAGVLPIEMAPIRTESGEIWHPAPAPEPATQAVPDAEGLSVEYTEHWERAHDRADWVGGATVTCDLGPLGERAVTAHLDMDEGVRLEGTVDVLSRVYTPIEDGRITFAVKERSGESRLMLGVVADGVADREEWAESGPPEPEDFTSRPLRIRWHGAEPGTTVGCDGVWAVETGTLAVHVVDRHGDPVETGPQSMAVLKGCGFMVPLAVNPVEVEVEAGNCALQLERRAPRFPLIAARSEPVLVQIPPGGLRELTMTLPDPPPLYQPPDLLEVATAADIAAFFGADVAAEALEELIDRILAGEWDEGLMEELARNLRPDPPDQEISAQELEALRNEDPDPDVLRADDGDVIEILHTEDGEVMVITDQEGTTRRVPIELPERPVGN